MLEDTTRVNLLYDFYGSLLTEKQRECLELYYQDDLSLAEIADQDGISRQGVHDIVKRAVKTLDNAEKSLGLVARFTTQEKDLKRLHQILSQKEVMDSDRTEALVIVEKLME
ncbi:MAG: YlxM family DNA-binding protein [Firmicutes bacterium]|nr:YlxM family DNA-binding protein [Bacillota bacterium]